MKLLLHIKKEWYIFVGFPYITDLWCVMVYQIKKNNNASNIQKWNMMMPTSIPKDLFWFHEKGIEALSSLRSPKTK